MKAVVLSSGAVEHHWLTNSGEDAANSAYPRQRTLEFNCDDPIYLAIKRSHDESSMQAEVQPEVEVSPREMMDWLLMTSSC